MSAASTHGTHENRGRAQGAGALDQGGPDETLRGGEGLSACGALGLIMMAELLVDFLFVAGHLA